MFAQNINYTVTPLTFNKFNNIIKGLLEDTTHQKSEL